jgi:hypothetical protein
MRIWPLLLFPILLSACASTPDSILSENEAEAQAEATKECLSDAELGNDWGECNVKKTLFSRMTKIRACYAKDSNKKYDFHGDLILKIHVFPNGKVKETKVEEGSLKNKMLSTCLVKEISRMRFARPPKGIHPVIYFPFNLELVKP